jgi:hypothetical protein
MDACSLSRITVALLALASIGSLGGCRDAQPQAAGAPARTAPIDLTPCPPGAWAHGGGEDWAVAGVSCEAVGRFVLKRFEPHPGNTSQTKAGFICRIEQIGPASSPLHVFCAARDRRRFRFVFS